MNARRPLTRTQTILLLEGESHARYLVLTKQESVPCRADWIRDLHFRQLCWQPEEAPPQMDRPPDRRERRHMPTKYHGSRLKRCHSSTDLARCDSVTKPKTMPVVAMYALM